MNLKPDHTSLCELLFYIQDAMGRAEAAEETLARYAATRFDRPSKAYLKIAQGFAERGELDNVKALRYN